MNLDFLHHLLSKSGMKFPKDILRAVEVKKGKFNVSFNRPSDDTENIFLINFNTTVFYPNDVRRATLLKIFLELLLERLENY